MAVVDYIEFGEPVDDVVSNRPVKSILSLSGLDPDADFPGFLGELFVQENGVAVGTGIKTLNFVDATLTPNGTVLDIDVNAPQREAIIISTGPMAFEDEVTGVVALGAMSAILYAQSLGASWLRLYATAADRTADAARDIADDPTTPIILELIFAGAETILLNPNVLAANLDVPLSDNIYYSIVQLEGSGATGTLFMSDTQPDPGSWPVNGELNGAAITNPLVSGATTWEYNSVGGLLNTVTWALYGGIIGGNNGNPPVPCRIAGATFDHSSLLVTVNTGRTAADGGNGQFVNILAHMPSTAINSYTGQSTLYAQMERDTATTVNIYLMATDGAGVETIIDSALAVAYDLNENRKLILEIIAGTATVYLTDTAGLNPVAHATGAVPGGISANDQIGLMVGWVGGTGFYIGNYSVADEPAADQPADVTITRTILESA